MTEREIFLDALEREDPADRAAYLDRVCAGRPALRAQVEVLLRYHREEPAFLNVPVMEQLAAAEESLAFLGRSCEPASLGRLDHYEVLEMLGRGSTGIVLKARDTKLQRIVAIKALAPRLAASPSARQRFICEAQAAAAVRDDHVVSIHAVSDQGAVPYLVMEYIHGMTLEQRIQQDKPLQLPEILRIGMQLAAGLAAAHAQGLVHRDIKPANILLENSVQRVKITDFGLARAVAEAKATAADTVAGTPPYMSPEQARGEPTDQRTDLFSLGSVLYLLCGRQPAFDAASTSAVLRRVREGAPEPIRKLNPAVPEWLADLISKLQASEPAARPQSAREVAELLGSRLALLQQPPIAPVAKAHIADVQVGQAQSRAPGARRLWMAIAVVMLLAALAVLAVLLWLRQRPSAKAQGYSSAGAGGPPVSLNLMRGVIPRRLLAVAGGGDPAHAPAELAAVLGDGRFLLPHIGAVLWMQQSPDMKTLAVPLDDDVVLFDVQTGEQLRRLRGPGGRVVHVSFSRDSRLLAASTWYEGSGGAVRVWDLDRRKTLFTKQVPGSKVRGATAFSADGSRLVGEGGKGLHVWDTQTGKELQTIPINPSGCGLIAFSPQGGRLAVALWNDRSVKVFDWDGKKLLGAQTLKGHTACVMTVAFSPDGKILASGDQKEFILWDADSLQKIRTIDTPAQELAFTPDSRTLYASATTAKSRLAHTWTRWVVANGRELKALSVKVGVEPMFATHCLSQDGRTLFLGPGQHYASHVRAIDTATGKDVFARQGHAAPLNAVAISPNGRILASAGHDQVIKVWDLSTGRVLHSFAAHRQPVWGLSFSPNGEFLASGSCDGTIVLWDLASGTAVRTLTEHSRSPSRIQFSPDGAVLAAGGEDGSIKRWEAISGAPRDVLGGHDGVVRAVAFSRDGRLLASGGEDRKVVLHDTARGTSRVLRCPRAINDLAFSPDGHMLVAVTDGPQPAVRVWDLKTGKEVTWNGHTGDVHGVAFSPVGSLIATCADDGTVRLWDSKTSRPTVRTIGPGPFGGPVRAVAFTPDGRYLATANANGMVYLLRVEKPRMPRSEPSPAADSKTAPRQ